MCGRFAFYSAHEAMPALFGVENAAAVQASYNIAPTQAVAAIRLDKEKRRRLGMLRWGLIPSWAKEKSIGNRMINARAETVAEKPSFRSAFRRRRCLIPADGYYEWQKTPDGKQPYYICAADRSPLALAGLWERWTDKATDEVIETCTIITQEANQYVSQFHHRMPVIVGSEDMNRWLDADDSAAPDEIVAAECDDALLQGWPVSKSVNSPRNNSAELIEAVES